MMSQGLGSTSSAAQNSLRMSEAKRTSHTFYKRTSKTISQRSYRSDAKTSERTCPEVPKNVQRRPDAPDDLRYRSFL